MFPDAPRHAPARERAAGFVSFYWGRTIAEYAADSEKKPEAAVIGAWLQFFQDRAEAMQRP